MLKVAITGASGFIGRQLVSEHLARGDKVNILSRRDVSFPKEVCCYVGDIARDLPHGFPGDADILYHCAAELKDPGRMTETNVLGTRRLVDAADGRIGRWVQLSSVGVYGQHREGLIDEAWPISPDNDYERTKATADQIVQERACKGAFGLVTLRPSIVFGRGMPNRSLLQLGAVIERGLFFFVGPAGASANYVPAPSVVSALVLCGTHPAATGNPYALTAVGLDYHRRVRCDDRSGARRTLSHDPYSTRCSPGDRNGYWMVAWLPLDYIARRRIVRAEPISNYTNRGGTRLSAPKAHRCLPSRSLWFGLTLNEGLWCNSRELPSSRDRRHWEYR